MRKQAFAAFRCRMLCLAFLSFALLFSAAAIAERIDDTHETAQPRVSPFYNINHPRDRAQRARSSILGDLLGSLYYRSIDGSANNLFFPLMGRAFTPLKRIMPSDYSDSISEMAGSDRPSAREISNIVHAQQEPVPNLLGASDFLWQWGQFLDHDIDLSGGADPAEPANIPVPVGDPFFDPRSTGTEVIEFNRTIYFPSSGHSPFFPRQQLNEITTWIDASNVYGSDLERAYALRTLDGTGKLKVSQGNLLPFNVDGLPNAGGDSPTLFLAGDVRANEQVGLTALHTLFVREHNRLADELKARHPRWTGYKIYREARRLVGAQMQVITYQEFLPALLGPGALRPYRGYRPFTDASIMNSFSTAVYRFGHSALSPTLLRLEATGETIPEGNLQLRDAFFSPHRIIEEGGIEPLLRGLAHQACQRVDAFLVDDVRNFLFGSPGSGGFDLASLNIQRGRDHGLPSYNDTRAHLGLARRNSFAQVTSDAALQDRLADAYESVDDIDLWVGALSEDPVNGGHLGEVAFTVLKAQFEALRDGDRFWYERYFTALERLEIEKTRLSDIIRRNTDIGGEIPDDVFTVEP